MTHTSTAVGRVLPRRRTVRSSSALRSLAWRGSERSPNLIEEEGSTLRGLKEAGLRMAGVGKCASLEAEEFSLEQSARYCSAIEIDEGPACSGSMTVEVCREESFAGTRLSLEQHHWQPPSARQLSEQSVDLLTYHLRCVALTDKGDHSSQPILCLLFGPCGAESERHRFDDVAYPPPSSVLWNRNRPWWRF